MSRARAEHHGVIARHTNPFLIAKTHPNGHFLGFMLILGCFRGKSGKNGVVCDHHPPAPAAVENFLNLWQCQNKFANTCLGPRVRAEANGVVIGCVKRIL